MKFNFRIFVYVPTVLVAMMSIGCSILSDQSPVIEEPWEKYYKAAEDARINQDYKLSEELFLLSRNEIEKFNIKDDTVYRRFTEIYRKQGRYREAVEYAFMYFKHAKDVFDYDRNYLCNYYRDIGQIYLAHGDYVNALKCFEQALDVAGTIEKQNPLSVGKKKALARNILAEYNIELGNYPEAQKYLTEGISELSKRFGVLPQDIAYVKNRLGMAYYCAGEDREAERLFEDAAGINTKKVAIPFPDVLAVSLTMLGRIAEHRGEYEKAIKNYRTALDVLQPFTQKYKGNYRVERADVWNRIGRFYRRQCQPEDSAKAYNEAIALRQATGTQTHPNCADAINGLADVAAYRGDLTSATLQAQAALKVLDTALVPTHPRIAPTLVALASLGVLAGHPEEAAPLYARLETILQKPLGPWKEDFMDTTAFYAGLLKKAGKPADAARLEELQARQKPRR